MIDFIGLGAQKSGTSWVYACLFEHPEICIPIKELHYFSRDRFSLGRQWYEDHFKACGNGRVRGEFSTSYLATKEAAARIADQYPQAKLIAILRQPITRAISEYGNAAKAGEREVEETFDSYASRLPTVLTQGLYHQQLLQYQSYYTAGRLLVLVYEDSLSDPASFMRQIYTFLGVNPDFTPASLRRQINIARQPRAVWVDTLMHKIAEGLRRLGVGGFVHAIKTSGLTDGIRRYNTTTPKEPLDTATITKKYKSYFSDDVQALSGLLGRDLNTFWNI